MVLVEKGRRRWRRRSRERELLKERMLEREYEFEQNGVCVFGCAWLQHIQGLGGRYFLNFVLIKV